MGAQKKERNEEERDEDGGVLRRFKGKLVFSSIVIFNGVYREERGV